MLRVSCLITLLAPTSAVGARERRGTGAYIRPLVTDRIAAGGGGDAEDLATALTESVQRMDTKQPPWPVQRQRPPADENEVLARRIARLVLDAEAAARLARLCALLVIGGMRLAGRVAVEVSASLVFKTVAVVELRGAIIDERDASSRSLWTGKLRSDIVSVRRVERALERAFGCRRIAAVVLRISSPGGTASESALLFHKLRSLKAKRRRRSAWSAVPKGPLELVRAILSIPALLLRRRRKDGSAPEVLAYVEDVCTSGAFYAACAADEIVATPCALVGSIGVVARSFGYAKQLKKLGVERRLLASGDAKVGLDPFVPLTRDALARELRVLNDIHADFVKTVESSRAHKLDRAAAAALAARANARAWTLKGWLNTWPFRMLLRSKRQRRGDGLFDGSVHAARTALKLGLIDEVCEWQCPFLQIRRCSDGGAHMTVSFSLSGEDSFVEAIRRRYGPRVYIKHFRTLRDYSPLASLLRQPPVLPRQPSPI